MEAFTGSPFVGYTGKQNNRSSFLPSCPNLDLLDSKNERNKDNFEEYCVCEYKNQYSEIFEEKTEKNIIPNFGAHSFLSFCILTQN